MKKSTLNFKKSQSPNEMTTLLQDNEQTFSVILPISATNCLICHGITI